jgi:hypothetical protein
LINTEKCQSRDHFNKFFHELCNERPKETRAEGIVLRDPSAWYFKNDAFFKKKVKPTKELSTYIFKREEETIVMKTGKDNFKWYGTNEDSIGDSITTL